MMIDVVAGLLCFALLRLASKPRDENRATKTYRIYVHPRTFEPKQSGEIKSY
jgi:hypothetical protein